MKIEINEQQPLDEVVAALKSKGYKPSIVYEKENNYIHALSDGYFIATVMNVDKCRKLTTLAELKEM
jgi:hypothetical protein